METNCLVFLQILQISDKMPQCAAPDCRNHNSRNLKSGVSFHRFPRDSFRLSDWLSRIGREEYEPTVNSRICSAHFPEESFDRSGEKVTLKRNAMPALTKGSNQRVISLFVKSLTT